MLKEKFYTGLKKF